MGRRFVAMLFVVGLVATGCAASVKTTMPKAPAESVAKFKTMVVIVKSSVADSAEEADKFHRILTSALASRSRWDIVASNSDVTLTATMVELSKISRAEKVILGTLLAGPAAVETSVVLTNGGGKVITEFHVTSKSSRGTPLGGTIDEAYFEAAKEIATVLQRL